jgi:Tfp pilus assembly protein PilF
VSLLADLLSKVKYKSASVGEGRKTDVPPDLKRVVSSSAEKEATKKRILILSVLVLLAIAAGVGAVYLMELYIKPSAKKRMAKTTTPAQIATRPTLPQVESPKPQAPATKSELSKTKPKAAKPKPAKEIPKQKPEQKKTPEPKAEPKAENFQKDAEKKPAIAQEPQPKPQDSQKDVYLYTARTYESKKDYHQALLNYKKAMEIDPGNYIIMNNISSVLIHLGSFEESIKYAKNVLAIKKDYVPSLINIGIAYIRLNNPAEGEAYLSKALSIEPSNSYALLNLGLLYEKRGDNDRAYGYFSKLSEMGNIQGHLGIARIAEKQGRSSDAVRIYREILSMNNIDPRTRKLVNDRLLLLGN